MGQRCSRLTQRRTSEISRALSRPSIQRNTCSGAEPTLPNTPTRPLTPAGPVAGGVVSAVTQAGGRARASCPIREVSVRAWAGQGPRAWRPKWPPTVLPSSSRQVSAPGGASLAGHREMVSEAGQPRTGGAVVTRSSGARREPASASASESAGRTVAGLARFGATRLCSALSGSARLHPALPTSALPGSLVLGHPSSSRLGFDRLPSCDSRVGCGVLRIPSPQTTGTHFPLSFPNLWTPRLRVLS